MALSRAERFERNYGAYADTIRFRPCSVRLCGNPDIEAHHAIPRSRGGWKRHLVPLCRQHHAEGHTKGWQTFERKYSVCLADEAERLWVVSGEAA